MLPEIIQIGTVDSTKVLARSPGGQGDKLTRQRFCAINLRFIVAAKVHYIQSRNVRVRDSARPLNVECCVGPGTPCAPVPPSPSLRCANWSAASVLAIARRQRCRYPIGTFALVRRRTRGAAFPNRSTTLPTSPFLPASGSVLPTPGHVLGPADKPLVVLGVYSTMKSAIHCAQHRNYTPIS